MTAMDAKVRDWNELICDVVAGRWTNPETGAPARLPFETIHLDETLEGQEAELVRPLDLGSRLAVVSDANTVEAMGRRIAKALREFASIEEVVLPADLSCDEDAIAFVQDRTRYADGLVSVGSGSLSDTCKYATFRDGRRYAAFATAASMNGYAASTASVTLRNGYKTSLSAHAPRGIFFDLKVSAEAPTWLSAAGLGDSLCRSTAQVDWWASHRLFGTFYSSLPYVLQGREELQMLDHAAGLARHDLTANGILQRLMTLCGLGVCFTGISHHGSMGEHQISHWVDMFAGSAHPGTTHGQQVGVASLVMARLQERILSMEEPPRVAPTPLAVADFEARYGRELGPLCFAEARKKALDPAGAAAFNARLGAIWPELRAELKSFALPLPVMEGALKAAGGPTTAAELGLPLQTWRNAVKYARDIRNRWSFLDLADDSGILDDFVKELA
ncbi:MAG: iron-containing alcohol dehydrogenase [Hyphomicrobiales bacterium]